MFEDSLLESGGKHSRMQKRGPWATVASFAFEIALVCVLVVIPLIYTDVLPMQRLACILTAPAPPPAQAPATAEPQESRQTISHSEIDHNRLMTPRSIPQTIARLFENAAPPSNNTIGVPFSTGGPGTPNGVPGGIPVITLVVVPPARVAPPKPVPVSSGVSEGLLVRRVQPSYPPLARAARISGGVLLQAVIGKDGTIRQLQVVSGHPMLVQSALEAVRQWRYKPYLLNGEPVEVDTQVTVNFTLTGG